jgi:spectinomycin phosphotransferase
VREAPTDVRDTDVLDLVRRHWHAGVDALSHLPVGFGAWHWRATAGEAPVLFVSLDRLAGRHTGPTLEAAYRGAADLAAVGLDFVLAPLVSGDGSMTAGLGDDRVSVTPWVDGDSGDGDLPDPAAAAETAAMLAALHATPAPAEVPAWAPLVDAGLPQRLAEQAGTPWDSGPYGERARSALGDRLADVTAWVERYLDLARRTSPATWVTTHGEPHTRNQVRTGDGRTLLVDWESLKLAPAERDLRYLVEQGHGSLCRAEPSLVEMFDLEWRLDEVAQYAAWFQAPHTGTESDRVALGGLLHELARPPGRTG